MREYINLGWKIINEGNHRPSRPGINTISKFGPQMEFDLRKGFPLVTTKKVHLKGIIAELLWFLEGSTNARRLNDMGAKIWDEWALKEDVTRERDRSGYELLKEYAAIKNISTEEAVRILTEADTAAGFNHATDPFNTDPTKGGLKLVVEAGVSLKHVEYILRRGELGPVYGAQWCSWPTPDGQTINQIAKLQEELKKNPYSRRHLVNTWNVPYLPDESKSPQDNVKDGKMALAPCHVLFQFYVEEIPLDERIKLSEEKGIDVPDMDSMEQHSWMDEADIPARYLSCKLYQR